MELNYIFRFIIIHDTQLRFIILSNIFYISYEFLIIIQDF